MTHLSQLYTASSLETRLPGRESEREYFTRLARERKIERRSERRRELIGRITRRPHGRKSA